MNYGQIIASSIFSVLQVYILIGVGMIAFYTKIFDSKSTKKLSNIVVTIFFPLYGIMNVCKVTDWGSVSQYWLIVVNCALAHLLGKELIKDLS